jgi:deoxyribodipyrimidine photo-lyase
MEGTYSAGLMWFRRDLRAHDNAALHHALKSCRTVFCVFVFDTDILQGLPRRDRRVEFILKSVAELDVQLRALSKHGRGGGLICRHGSAAATVEGLAIELGVQAVFTNHDYEASAIRRDEDVRSRLQALRIALHTFKDQVVFERSELLTQGGKPYSVFTPYKNAWLAKLDPFYLKSYAVEPYAQRLAEPAGPGDAAANAVPSLSSLGFETTNLSDLPIPAGVSGARRLLADFEQRMDNYEASRNYPAVKGPSYLSVHLRFGTVSIRELASSADARARAGSVGAASWLSELIWRDFYFQVLVNFPYVAPEENVSASFRPAYDAIEWEQGEMADALFMAWCEGRTGYPLIDAAMAQINETGYMHNRLRMVVASFLCKDLGIDWRRGERYFARQLNDYDLAANNGGWQWASSSGCDAQPYFRVFNPVSQSRKFDPDGKFILRYLPQLSGLSGEALHAPWMASPSQLATAGVTLGSDYPAPIVDHDAARKKTLARYAAALKPPS